MIHTYIKLKKMEIRKRKSRRQEQAMKLLLRTMEINIIKKRPI